MVRLDRVSIRFGDRRVVESVSTALRAGVTGLIGPNGAGKSSLVRAMAGLLPCQGGVAIDDMPLATMSPRDRARRIAYLPQGQAVHWPLTVERLVALGRLPHLGPFTRPTGRDREAIERALHRTEMGELRDRAFDELSGGERARALLARALAVEAPLLLADEPLAALDPAHQIDVMALLRAEAERGVTVITVLHDLTLAARWCDRLLLMDQGRLVAEGAPADVLTAERIGAVYHISAFLGDVEGQPLIVPLAHR